MVSGDEWLRCCRRTRKERGTHRPRHARRTSANGRGVIPEEEAFDQDRRRVRLAGVIRKPTSNSAPGCGCPNGGKGYGTAPGAPGDCFIGEAALRDLVTSRGGCGDFRPRRAATPTQSHSDLACRWLAVARTRTRSPDRTDTSRQDRRRAPADTPWSPLGSTRALGRQPLGL